MASFLSSRRSPSGYFGGVGGTGDVPRRARRLGWLVLGLWTTSSLVALAAVLVVRQTEVRQVYALLEEGFAERTLHRLGAARGRIEEVLAETSRPARAPASPSADGRAGARPPALADLPQATRQLLTHEVTDGATFGALLRVWVTDREGRTLFASDPADLGKQEPCVVGLTGPSPAEGLRPAGGTVPLKRFHVCAGEEVLCLALPLVRGDTPVGWLAAHRSTVELKQELASARVQIRLGLFRLLVVFGVVCLILGVTLWYLVGRVSRAEAEASERARLASMGQLALAMAHEVRNPLNSISLICQYVLRLLGGGEEPPAAPAVIAEQVALVRDEVDKLAGVVDNIMRFTWPVEPVPQAASVAGVCRRAVELQQAELVKNRVEVTLDVPEELAAWIDADQVTRALINLVRNAVEAMPQGGTLQLTAAAEEGRVAIRVRDSGPGIGWADGTLAPGLRQGRSRPALGLPIAQAIIKEHGGELRAENHPSGGAVFTVLLPADEETYERRARAPGRG